MFMNQNKLEAHFSSEHPRSPSLKVMPPQQVTQSSPTLGEEPKQEAITPALDESARMALPDAELFFQTYARCSLYFNDI